MASVSEDMSSKRYNHKSWLDPYDGIIGFMKGLERISQAFVSFLLSENMGFSVSSLKQRPGPHQMLNPPVSWSWTSKFLIL